MTMKSETARAIIKSKQCYCTLQDEGRGGQNHRGIPAGGPMDSQARDLANALLDNNSNDAVLEVGPLSLTLEFENAATVSVIAGIGEVSINGLLAADTLLMLRAGDVLQLEYARSFAFRYIGIKGGWQGDRVLNSRSTLPSLGMRPLSFQSEISFHTHIYLSEIKSLAEYAVPQLKIPIFPGPDFHWLGADKARAFFSQPLTLDVQSNRQAFTFLEKVTVTSYPEAFNSTGCLPGMVQLTPSGKLFILMKDGQTTGGYLQILYIPEMYLPNLAQQLPGSKLNFVFAGSEKPIDKNSDQ